MKNKDNNNTKKSAILALPVSIALGICAGTMFGAKTQSKLKERQTDIYGGLTG